jgi:hypothetical protein
MIFPVVAGANDHNAEVAGSASFNNGGSVLFGPQVTVGKSFYARRDPNEPRPFCAPGVVGDISSHFGKENNVDENNTFLLAAGRCSFAKTRSLFHVLGYFGMAHTPDNNVSDGPKDLASGVGFAWDIAFGPHHVPTKQDMNEYSGWGLRLQADWIERKGERAAVVRMSAGVVYRFPRYVSQ